MHSQPSLLKLYLLDFVLGVFGNQLVNDGVDDQLVASLRTPENGTLKESG